MRRSYMIRTAIIYLITTLLQIGFFWWSGLLWDGRPTPLFWFAVIVYISLGIFALFQLSPKQTLPVWLFELRQLFTGAAIPFTVWSMLWARGILIPAMIPLTIGIIRFVVSLNRNRVEYTAESDTQQKLFTLLPMLILAVFMITIWVVCFTSFWT